MSLQTWVRQLKKIDFSNEGEVIQHVRKRFTELEAPSAMALLEKAIVEIVKDDASKPRPLKELGRSLPGQFLSVLTVDSAKNRLGAIRAAIREKFGEGSDLLNVFIIPKRVYANHQKKYNAKVAEENKRPVQVSGDKVEEVVKKTWKSSDLFDNIVLLQLASGARAGEILSFSRFEPVEGKKGWVKQIGLNKVKDGANRTVEKPIIFIPAETFLQWFSLVRGELKKRPGNLMTTLNRRVKSLFGVPNFSTHDLRKLYANISYEKFGKQQKPPPSQAAWVSKVLGHDENSLTSALSYTTRVVDGEVKQVNPPVFVEVPKNENKRDGLALERLEATVAALRQNGEEITTRKLLKYGYGMRVISQWSKQQQQ
mgnify:CR=1 FL=1